MTELLTLTDIQPEETPAPRFALAAKVTVAIGVALAVLVPATLSYGIPLFERPIENLTFSAGQQLTGGSDPQVTTSLDKDTLWTGPHTSGWEGETEFRSVSGVCKVTFSETHLSDSVVGANDKDLSAAYLRSVFPAAGPNAFTDAETSTAVGYLGAESGANRTMEGLVLTNSVSTSIVRAFRATRSAVVISVVCTTDSAESRALTSDALLHLTVTAK